MNSNSKVALVSGSSRGIGKAIAEDLVNQGFIVATNSRSEGGENHFAADLINSESAKTLVKDVLAKFGRLDVVVCNIGTGAPVDAALNSSDRWQHYLESNLFSASNLVDASMDALKESNGSVIAISSICGSSVISQAPIEYSVAKAALNMYFKSMASAHAANKVRFNVVSPGNVIFTGSRWEEKKKTDPAGIAIFLSENVPTKSFVSPAEVATAVRYFATNESANTTGVILEVDGGQSL